jgi:hypothetical protein
MRVGSIVQHCGRALRHRNWETQLGQKELFRTDGNRGAITFLSLGSCMLSGYSRRERTCPLHPGAWWNVEKSKVTRQCHSRVTLIIGVASNHMIQKLRARRPKSVKLFQQSFLLFSTPNLAFVHSDVRVYMPWSWLQT